HFTALAADGARSRRAVPVHSKSRLHRAGAAVCGLGPAVQRASGSCGDDPGALRHSLDGRAARGAIPGAALRRAVPRVQKPRTALAVSRRARWIVFGAALGLALLASTLAMPVRLWRTGEAPAPPLALVTGSAPWAPPARLWIDTDAACGAGRRVDPDDCFAVLLLLARTAPRSIVGVSAVGGNAPRSVVEATLRDLMAKADADVPVYGEAAAAALGRALDQGRLTILALGALTNIAAALRERPELAHNVARLVAVMGRREGHLFHPSEGRGRGMLFGHGPVFRDFNYAQDPQGAEDVLRSGVPLTMVPYDAARRLVLSASDLDSLAAAGGASAWVASQSRQWLEYWRQDVGLDGFYPFDLVAAAFLLRPDMFRCADVRWWIRPA